MTAYPLRFAASKIQLNRRDHFELFADTRSMADQSVMVVHGHQRISASIEAADTDLILLTPHDSSGLAIRPETIIRPQTTEFLHVDIFIGTRGKEIGFSGRIGLIPRILRLNDLDLKQMRTDRRLIAISGKASLTVWGDWVIERTEGISYAMLPKEEAEAALLAEGDLICFEIQNESRHAPVNDLPDRFQKSEAKGRNGKILITESQVWRAIRMRKKIFVPKNALITPAAKVLGRNRDVFEYEV